MTPADIYINVFTHCSEALEEGCRSTLETLSELNSLYYKRTGVYLDRSGLDVAHIYVGYFQDASDALANLQPLQLYLPGFIWVL